MVRSPESGVRGVNVRNNSPLSVVIGTVKSGSPQLSVQDQGIAAIRPVGSGNKDARVTRFEVKNDPDHGPRATDQPSNVQVMDKLSYSLLDVFGHRLSPLSDNHGIPVMFENGAHSHGVGCAEFDRQANVGVRFKLAL